jgi:DNA-directed RNA polymerase subunit K/omega
MEYSEKSDISKEVDTNENPDPDPDSDIEQENDPDPDLDLDQDQDVDVSDINSDSDNSDEEYDSDNPTKSINKSSKDNTELNEDNTVKNLLQSNISQEYQEEDDGSDSSDDEDNYQKLEISRYKLNDRHGNLQAINYIEVEKLSKVIRDSNNIIIDSNHTTVPILSKYEKTKILGLRTKQINSGAQPFISIDEEIIDGYTIAEKELIEKKIPFIIKRPISNNKFEYWKLEDLEIV